MLLLSTTNEEDAYMHGCCVRTRFSNGNIHNCGQDSAQTVPTGREQTPACYYHQRLIEGTTEPARVTFEDERVTELLDGRTGKSLRVFLAEPEIPMWTPEDENWRHAAGRVA